MTQANQSIDMGALRHLKILCISETGWFDNAALLGDIKAAGGMGTSQYALPWPPFGNLHPENAAGSSALVEVEEINGTVHTVLFDTGWGPEWMDQRFAEEGIDKRLQRGEIECLIISHEHFDHFWGIGSTLKHCPYITIYIPEGFHPEGLDFIQRSGHVGKVITVHPDEPVRLFAGVTLVNFRMETLLQVKGENVLYFNLKNKGIAMMTGCGHGGVLNLLDYARRTFKGGDKIYAVYGGLHISPFDEWDEERDKIVQALKEYHIEHIGCNHCTGITAVEHMRDAGLPIVHGTAQHRSKTDLFLGNGDALAL
jgi:7,8-dihydropterin-6-yl-methyl-4-(beta-D-ribofuranosyl)aminobenzene 5'-phosphate synthase